MIKTLVIPAIIIAAFLSIAATLMAIAPVLEPSSETAMPLTVRVQTVAKEAVELKVHSQGSLCLQQSANSFRRSPAAWFGHRLTWLPAVSLKPAKNWRELMTWTIEVPEIGQTATLKRATAEVEHAKYEYGRLKSLAGAIVPLRAGKRSAAYRVAQAPSKTRGQT